MIEFCLASPREARVRGTPHASRKQLPEHVSLRWGPGCPEKLGALQRTLRSGPRRGAWCQNVIPHIHTGYCALTITFISVYPPVDPRNPEKVRLSPCHGESHHPMKMSDLDTKREQHTVIPAITDPDLNGSDGVPEKLTDLPKVTELRWQSQSKTQTSATKAHAPSSTPPGPAEHERRVRRERGQHGLEASGRASWRRGSSS